MTDEFFDSFYSGGTGYYGGGARAEFEAFINALPNPEARVLDLACGQGRHTISAARAGARVHAIDYSSVAIEQLAAFAKAEKLPVKAECADIRELSLPVASYDAAVLVSTLSHFEEADLKPIVDMVFDVLAPGGLVFAEGFTTDDPGFAGADDASETTAALKHFFERGAFANLFGRLAITEYREFIEDDTAHGPVHQHGVALLIGRKG